MDDFRKAKSGFGMLKCPGILVSDDCWVLSQPAQSCADLCGGASRVDAETTVGGATTRMVVSALEAKYGLHDTSRDSLDAPCGWPPYLAEGEVQFPEWGMVSLLRPAHRTRRGAGWRSLLISAAPRGSRQAQARGGSVFGPGRGRT